jgi:hypothetical protein
MYDLDKLDGLDKQQKTALLKGSSYLVSALHRSNPLSCFLYDGPNP